MCRHTVSTNREGELLLVDNKCPTSAGHDCVTPKTVHALPPDATKNRDRDFDKGATLDRRVSATPLIQACTGEPIGDLTRRSYSDRSDMAGPRCGPRRPFARSRSPPALHSFASAPRFTHPEVVAVAGIDPEFHQTGHI
jgi:hypothetical protein